MLNICDYLYVGLLALKLMEVKSLGYVLQIQKRIDGFV